MRTPSVVLSSLLCFSSAIATVAFVAHQQELDDQEALGDDVGDEQIDVDVGVAHDSLTGRLLVASPAMQDPYFAGTVIYMLADDEEGSLGVVLNRSRGSVIHGGALAHLYDGGPVGRDHVFVLHNDLKSSGSVVISPGSSHSSSPSMNNIAVAAEPSILDDVMEGRGPDHARVFVGYAGWGPGQLDHELESGAWLVADAVQGQVLDDDVNAITRYAYLNARRP